MQDYFKLAYKYSGICSYSCRERERERVRERVRERERVI